MICPLCFSDHFNEYLNDNTRVYEKCVNCGLVFVEPKYYLNPTEEKARYDQHRNDPNNPGYRSFLMNLVSPLVPLLNSKSKGLDFGAGPTPALAGLFKELGFQLNRYDPFYANDKKLLEQTYDFITATEVVEHLHNPGKEFNRLFTMLKPGGFLGIMTNPPPGKKDFKNWWYKNDKTHVCFYSEKSVVWISKQWNARIKYRKGNVIVFRKEKD